MDLILCVNETRIDVYLPVHYNYIVYRNGVIFSLVSTPSKPYHQHAWLLQSMKWMAFFFQVLKFEKKSSGARSLPCAYTKDSNKTMHYIKSIAERCVCHKLSFHKYHRNILICRFVISTILKKYNVFNQYSFFLWIQ